MILGGQFVLLGFGMGPDFRPDAKWAFMLVWALWEGVLTQSFIT